MARKPNDNYGVIHGSVVSVLVCDKSEETLLMKIQLLSLSEQSD